MEKYQKSFLFSILEHSHSKALVCDARFAVTHSSNVRFGLET